MALKSEHNSEQIEMLLMGQGEGEVTLSSEFFHIGLAVIYLNNPGKKNAISGKMMVQLRQVVQQLEKWPEGKAVLICGTGKNFCSGGDLNLVKATGTPELATQMSKWMQETLTRLQNLPMFSVCLVQGPTIGGGAEIAVSCDFILATDDVKFGFVQGKMGIITAWGGTTRLVHKIGHTKALNLLLTAKIMSAQECREYDIADHIVPVEDAFRKTLEWIHLRLQHHHLIVRSFKETVNRVTKDTFEDSLSFERSKTALFWGGELNKKALQQKIKHIREATSKI